MRKRMRWIGAGVMGVLGICSVWSQTRTVEVYWTPSPTNEQVQAYRVYHSTNPSVPLSNWVMVVEVAAPTTNFFMLSVEPGQHYFTVRSTNFWGFSPFFVVASTPAAPAGMQSVGVR